MSGRTRIKTKFVSPTMRLYSDFADFAAKIPVNSPESYAIARQVGIEDDLLDAERRQVSIVPSKERRLREKAEKPVVEFLFHRFVLISPDGKRYSIDRRFKEFCDAHDLHSKCMYEVMKGIYSQHKGWTVERRIAIP